MIQPDPEFLSFGMCNGVLTPTSDLRISPLSSGFMFGEGLFETVAVKNSQPRLFQSHYARLSDSVRAFGAPSIAPESQLRIHCDAVIEANAVENGSLKIVIFKEMAGWSELIFARANTYPPSRYEIGFQLQTVRCEQRSDPLSGRKSLNYLANIQAKRAALAAGFDEPLFIDSREVVLEGATTNLFIVRGGAVLTPPLAAGILPGVMRAHILGRLGYNFALEQNITHAELLAADEVFVTNALLGVMPVARVDSTRYDLRQSPITRSLVETQ